MNADCLEAARAMLKAALANHKVAVLNMANAFAAGGGWLGGAGAQEEDLHRRSNLCDHLSNHRRAVPEHHVEYPLGAYGVVCSPDVCIFRGPESAGYSFLAEPFFVCVLSAAAYQQPGSSTHGWHRSSKRARARRSHTSCVWRGSMRSIAWCCQHLAAGPSGILLGMRDS